ncbi:pyridoxal phosphate-dependent aminotransferase [Pedobacter mucosus]|uniref:pyridoxal phosphate-dependent aminotransferase n=1 Tax=Pedobacter mucosus TaxID=2895286 RepID=UPI001EE47F07|nr:aminotransferase class I/II-fold pyridoxal phosphate-dependent enzyme [Pedobacter mucosus]UKT63914.1 aminotransferase class I/II-fold pyridoxal phosphate-dependent enzyme [Pedobacter mucosus]
MKVSVLASALVGSEIIKIGNEVNEMKRKGASIANLTIGDFDSNIYPIPAELKAGIVDAYHANQTNYPPADGVLPLRETVSELLKDRFGLEYNPGNILISGGSRPLIYATFLALVDPGDTVVFPAPSWNNNHYCHLTSAKAIAVETDAAHNFMPTAAQLKPHLKGATLLALCSPLNPTGTMFDAEALAEICDEILEENASRSADEKPLYLMYDQIYSLLTFGKEHVNPVSLRPAMKEFTVFVDGSSKCLAATGVRVGWGFGPEDIINRMKALVGHMGAWAPKAEQVAMAKYFADKPQVDQFLTAFKSQIQDSLNALYNGFNELKSEGFNVDAVEPMGAIYLTIKIDYIGKTTEDGQLLKDSADVNFYLIKEAGAALVPFSAFGNDHNMPWFRASVGACTLQDIKDMLPRIKAALSKLK